jgi:ribonuclease HI
MSKPPKLPFTHFAWTDGAVHPNPGIGGWGFVLFHHDQQILEAFGGDKKTTNNRMELQAVIEAIASTPPNEPLWINSDSMYVVNGYRDWICGWVKKEWEDVKNPDLWQQLWEVKKTRPQRVHIQWVKGHAGNEWNEYADALAEAGRLKTIEEMKENSYSAYLDRCFEMAIAKG